MRDISELLKPLVLIDAASVSADTTPASIDRNGFDAVMILLSIGAGGITFDATNKVEFKLTHSDDDSTYAAVATSDMVGVTVGTGGIIKSLIAAHAAATVEKFGYKGGKRYLKLLADFSGTHGAATPIGAIALLGKPLTAPVS